MSRDSLSSLAARCRIAARTTAPIGSEWKHYRGGYYKVVGYGIDEATGEVEIQYVPTSLESPEIAKLVGPNLEGLTFHRPHLEWNEVVTDGLLKFSRFRRVIRVERFVEA